ncbi:transmembrane protein 255A isoform X2 [Pseudophryne corroboree]|uniref:transmembrane protein 255A isoform X2 n=1 Tax=Pseudophryne corroboree TaxID=495146 RepID=UPI003081CE15
MLTQQQSQRTEIPASDSSGSFNRRRRNSIFVTVTLLIISTLILTVGLAATTRTENVTVGGYYPGVILGFGSILGIIGSNLIENKRQMLVASIVFISFGVIAAFCCAIVDGVFAARHLDLRPIYAGKCRYYISADSEHTTEVTCQIPARGSCFLKIKSNTCYCCELYNCGRIPPFLPLVVLWRPHAPEYSTTQDHQCRLIIPTTTAPHTCHLTLPMTYSIPISFQLLLLLACQMILIHHHSLAPVSCGHLLLPLVTLHRISHQTRSHHLTRHDLHGHKTLSPQKFRTHACQKNMNFYVSTVHI